MSNKEIMVRATAPGYYKGLRKEGDVFAIEAPHEGMAMVYPSDAKEVEKGVGPKKQKVTLDPFSENWMEKGKLDKAGNFIPDDSEEAKAEAAERKAQEEAEKEAAEAAKKSGNK